MKLLPKQRILMLLVNIRAGKGTPPGVVQEKIFGACGGTVTESPIQETESVRCLQPREHRSHTIKNSASGKQSMIARRQNRRKYHGVHERCSYL